MAFMIAAYAVLWIISFGLVLSIVLRQRRLEAELQAVRHTVEDQDRSRREMA